MNRVAKGRRTEREIEMMVREAAFETYRPAWNRWSRKDVFKFDIIAIKKRGVMFQDRLGMANNGVIPLLLFLQVKSNVSDFYKARKEIEKWIKEHEEPEGVFYAVVLKDKNGIRVWGKYNGEVVEWTA
jgi:aromatic ring-opening dioxygenase LigB subunit